MTFHGQPWCGTKRSHGVWDYADIFVSCGQFKSLELWKLCLANMACFALGRGSDQIMHAFLNSTAGPNHTPGNTSIGEEVNGSETNLTANASDRHVATGDDVESVV